MTQGGHFSLFLHVVKVPLEILLKLLSAKILAPLTLGLFLGLPKKLLFWPFIKILSVISVLGILIFFIILPNWSDPLSNEQLNKIVNSDENKAGEVRDSKISHQEEPSTLNIEEETAHDSKISQKIKSSAFLI